MAKKILVVDDEKEIAELMMDLLKAQGYETLWEDDGRRGFETSKQEVPDLIILDLMLHDIHGINVCKMLKADPVTQNIPVIIYSGRMEPGITDDVMKAGGAMFMSKLTPPTKIIQIVKEYLK
ncbi:MAG: response regulator [Candidatus Omnitrophica bacterium]|nr:response regulator [Candidatus Omnitrophota bacterium]